MDAQTFGVKTRSRRLALGAAVGALAWSAFSAARAYDSSRASALAGKRRHATGHTEVETRVPTVFDQVAGGPSLAEVQLTEKFRGDIEGEGTVRIIQAARNGGTASFTGIERVRGSIGGRAGTFLLQVSGTVAGKEMKSEWFVVPGSGTGDLKGLRGDGGFEAQVGQHGSIWLDYSFE